MVYWLLLYQVQNSRNSRVVACSSINGWEIQAHPPTTTPFLQEAREDGGDRSSNDARNRGRGHAQGRRAITARSPGRVARPA